jgi:DNA-binding MarR family transcriptional regulator
MKKSIELTANQKTWMQIETVFAITQRARDLELAKIGLTIQQAMVLYYVKISPEPVTPMKLARIMYKQPHTVSALIHRMEVNGLVKTKHDLKRKNWLRISVTTKGEEALQRWPDTTTVPDILASALSKEDFEALAIITKKLHTAGIKALRQMEPNPFDEALFW